MTKKRWNEYLAKLDARTYRVSAMVDAANLAAAKQAWGTDAVEAASEARIAAASAAGVAHKAGAGIVGNPDSGDRT